MIFNRASSKIIFLSAKHSSKSRSFFTQSYNFQKKSPGSRASSTLNQSLNSSEKIKILDTTLRDGIQCAKVHITHEGGIRIAKVLEELNVDYIEAGCPASSEIISNFIQDVTKIVRTPTISAHSKLNKTDIERAAESLKYANKARLSTFISTNPIHLKHILKLTEEEVLENIHNCVSHAKALINDVCWRAEDSTRADPKFLYKAIETAIDAGASCITIADAVGLNTLEQSTELFISIYKNVKNIHLATLSAHFHNDLGLAVANSLAAIKAGARQIDCTINGIGERAGNAALEEVVMAIKMKYQNFYTEVDTRKLFKASKTVEEETNLLVADNKAIVGDNVFIYENETHKDGIIENKKNYEWRDSYSVDNASSFSVGISSGKARIKNKIIEECCGSHENKILDDYGKHFKRSSEKKGSKISDLEMISLNGEIKNKASIQNFRIFFSDGSNQETLH